MEVEPTSPNPETEEQELELPPSATDAWKQWNAAPNPRTMSIALKTVQPVIDRAVARFPKFNKAVLQGEAKRLAIQAVKTFNPSESASLSTHVFNHLRPLARFTQSASRAVTVPEKAGLMLGALKRAEKDFYEQYNREPTDAELQDLTGMPAKQMANVRRFDRFELAEGAMEAPLDMPEEDPKIGMWADYVYQDLGSLDQSIMDHRTGRHGKQILGTDELAAKLKVHPTYINRRAAQIAQRILDGVNQSR